MSQDDFNFLGYTTQTSDTYRVQNSAYRQGVANGYASTNNGGEAMLGQGSVNSLLPDPIASSSAGDYCRSMIFSEDDDSQTSGRYWCGSAALGTASGGPLYPVTSSPGDKLINSISIPITEIRQGILCTCLVEIIMDLIQFITATTFRWDKAESDFSQQHHTRETPDIHLALTASGLCVLELTSLISGIM